MKNCTKQDQISSSEDVFEKRRYHKYLKHAMMNHVEEISLIEEMLIISFS